MFIPKDSGDRRQLLDGVSLRTLGHGEKMLMGEFTLEQGAMVPLHEHPHEQAGFLVSGKLRFVVGDETFDAEPGDSWCVPGGVEHSAEALVTSVAVEVFSPVREDYLP